MIRNRKSYRLLLPLFWTFFRIGPMTFGGGYAMMPAIEREVVDKKRWMERGELADMASLAGLAPGGFGVNAAAFVGYRKAGLPGALAALAGMTLPTFLLILAIGVFYVFFHEHPKVEAALNGMKGAVIALIALAGYRMAKASIFDWTTIVLSVGGFVLLFLKGVHPMYIILSGLVAGIVLVKGKMWFGMKVQTEKSADKTGNFPPVYPEYYI